MLAPTVVSGRRNPWNKGKLIGQKAPLKLREIWAIRIRLELADRMREFALFNLVAQHDRESWMAQRMRGCFDSNIDHAIHKGKKTPHHLHH